MSEHQSVWSIKHFNYILKRITVKHLLSEFIFAVYHLILTKMSKRDDISVLKIELNNPKLDIRKSAVKKVIGSMTLGKDVSSLFTDVLKCVETEDLELKKLVYLYIINYAKTKPDLALMAINTFRKDSTERVNPLIRSLAVRTMGCIGIE
jgi:vesicle coat complex subunit